MNILTKIKESIINSFYPKHIKCICCKEEIEIKNVHDTCSKCKASLPIIKDNFCTRCGVQFDKDGTGVCLRCKSTNYHFEFARASFAYSNQTALMIQNLKYNKYKFLAEPFAHYLNDTLSKQNWKIDLISYVPLYPTREKQRGYNQARELATHLSKITGIPLFEDIIRKRETPTQTKLSLRERQENVKDCFKLTTRKGLEFKNILIIDDVFTSGSTTNEISKVFKQANVNKVYVLTLANAGGKQKI